MVATNLFDRLFSNISTHVIKLTKLGLPQICTINAAKLLGYLCISMAASSSVKSFLVCSTLDFFEPETASRRFVFRRHLKNGHHDIYQTDTQYNITVPNETQHTHTLHNNEHHNDTWNYD